MNTSVTLTRECNAIEIPAGHSVQLPAGSRVVITQTLGGSYTVQSSIYGALYRIAAKDADALGLEVPISPSTTTPARGTATAPVEEALVWDQLKSCYDPEIPVNIVDLGLVYDLGISPHASGGSRVDVKMTLTAPGCGMGTSIAADAQHKIEQLPGVKEAVVQLVWDPPWNAEMMSLAGKRQLGIS
jgi:probable FeS assembly SUF system protein SufT